MTKMIFYNPQTRRLRATWKRIQRDSNAHKSSPRYVAVSTPTPLLIFFISSVLIFVMPTPTACSLPSACIATSLSVGINSSAGGKYPPAEVRPGHIMCAPARRNRMAPRSTCTFGRMYGSGEQVNLCPTSSTLAHICAAFAMWGKMDRQSVETVWVPH